LRSRGDKGVPIRIIFILRIDGAGGRVDELPHVAICVKKIRVRGGGFGFREEAAGALEALRKVQTPDEWDLSKKIAYMRFWSYKWGS